MKKVFLDANIIIDFIDGGRVGHSEADSLIKYLMTNSITIVISEDSINVIYHNLRKAKIKQTIFLEFIKAIMDKWVILSFGVDCIRESIDYSKNTNISLDYSLQINVAKRAGCSAIYTTDGDFPESTIPLKNYSDRF